MEDLPDEIIDEIIQRVHKSSLIQVSEVCRLWNRIASKQISSIVTGQEFQKALVEGDFLSISRLNKHPELLNPGLYYACAGGNIEAVDFIIRHGATGYDFGLKGACARGDFQIALKMIELGGRSYNSDCMSLACAAGSRETIELMIKKGWDDCGAMTSGLISACVGRHYHLIDLMIEKGADLWLALYHFQREGDHEIVEYLKTKIH